MIEGDFCCAKSNYSQTFLNSIFFLLSLSLWLFYPVLFIASITNRADYLSSPFGSFIYEGVKRKTRSQIQTESKKWATVVKLVFASSARAIGKCNE